MLERKKGVEKNFFLFRLPFRSMGSAEVLDLMETFLRTNKKIGNSNMKEAKTPGCTAPPWFLCSPSHSCLPDQDSE